MAKQDNYIGIAMGLDVSDLKAGLAETAKAIQQAETKFKSATSGMDGWKDSAEGVGAELEFLTEKLDNQKRNVRGYQRDIEELTDKYGENWPGNSRRWLRQSRPSVRKRPGSICWRVPMSIRSMMLTSCRSP